MRVIDSDTTAEEVRTEIVDLYGPTGEAERKHFVILLKLLEVKARIDQHYRGMHGLDDKCRVAQ